jgi:hypothetical protein
MGVISCGTTLIDQGKFENIGAITWQTTAKTSNFTAVSGEGYFVNTTSGAITVTLPSSPSAGDIVAISDYANTADTNNITIARNGSPVQGGTSDLLLEKEGGEVTLIYVDGTQGWLIIDAAQSSDIVNPFIQATGGTITTSGNFKIHTFTSPGTFCVSGAGSPAGSTTVDYMVVAGGAGGGGDAGCGSGASGGGGAGGFRESHSTPVSGCYTASPLATPTALPVSVQGYPITVGAGGTAGCVSNPGGSGANSVFSTITSAGGGGGGRFNRTSNTGGSGGGQGANNGSGQTTGSAGNTPPVSPPQGNKGGNSMSFPGRGSSGGGGATAAGGNNPSGNDGTAGGAGATTNITASPVAYSGGGGGGGWDGASAGSGGTGGGGAGGSNAPGSNGTANTGGAGGGAGPTNAGGTPARPGGTGGSGIVVIRYKYQ